MKTLFSLIKLQLNTAYGLSVFRHHFKREKKKLWKPTLIFLSVSISLGSLTALLGAFMYGVFIAGKAQNHPELVLTIGFVASQMVVLFFGIIYIIAAFYFSKDLDILIPLPIKPSYILTAKFMNVLINEYVTMIPVLLPSILVYGIFSGEGAGYWAKATVLFFVAPALPLAIGGIIVVFIMRFVNLRKSKDALTVIGGLLGILFAVGVNIFTQRIQNASGGAFLKDISALESVENRFPPAAWAARGLSQHGVNGLLWFFLFLGVCIVGVLLLISIGGKFYYKTALAGNEAVSRKRGTALKWNQANAGSPLKTLYIKEWKVFIRTPVYAMNGLSGIVMGSVMAFVMLFGKANKKGEFLSIINNPKYILPVTLGMLGFILFTAGMNVTSSTSISREGSGFWISKIIPSPPRLQMLAKLMHGLSVSAIGVIVTGSLLFFFLKIPLYRFLIVEGLSFMGIVSTVSINLIIDILHPKLEWTNPQEAVKSNLNGLLGILANFVVIGIIALFIVFMMLANLNEWMLYLSIAIFFIVLNVPVVLGLFALAERRYRSIEA